MVNPELSENAEIMRRVMAEVDALVSSVSAEQLNWKPDPRRRSIGGCVEHLNTTARAMAPTLKAVIDRVRERGNRAVGPFSYGVLGRTFLRYASPETRSKKSKTPGMYVPVASAFRAEPLLVEFRRLHEEYLGLLERADGLDLRSRVSSPALRIMRFPIGIWLAMTPRHAARHFDQMNEVAASPGYPAAAAS